MGPHCLHPFLPHNLFPVSIFPHSQCHYSPHLSDTAQCSHLGFWKRARGRGKLFIFQKKTFETPKKHGKLTLDEQHCHSFSLLKCKTEEMLPGIFPIPESCCLAAQERCGGKLGEPGAMVPTYAMPLAGTAGGFLLTLLKLLFLASLAPEEADCS